MKKWIAISIGVFIAIILLQYSYHGIINDMSMQPALIQDSGPQSRPPVYLVSYAEGKEYFYRNQNAMTHSAINKGIDFIFNYRKSHIEKGFYEKNKQILEKTVGAGLMLWKPYFIAKTLKEVPEGAIVIYLDAAWNVDKPIDWIIKMLKDKDVVLVQDRERLNGAFVKGDSFALTGCTEDECRYLPHIWSSIIMIKNSVASRKFINQWLEYAKDIRILDAQGYGIMDNYPEFQWHHYDQSVLSLVYCKNQSITKVLKVADLSSHVSWFHRKPGKSSPNKPCYTVYGVDPVINFSHNEKRLPSTALLNLPPVVMVRKFLINLFAEEKICQ